MVFSVQSNKNGVLTARKLYAVILSTIGLCQINAYFLMFARPLFTDRTDAAEQLAEQLLAYRDRNALVLAIPRGAVPMGKIIADRLNGELDVVLIRKLGAPYNEEFAIGAVAEDGWVYLPPNIRSLYVSDSYIEKAKVAQLEKIRERRVRYTPLKPPADPGGRTVIIVDDGLATGATMIAALHAIREKRPEKLICAIPVAAPDSLEKVRELADEVVCLEAPLNFQAVGQFYEHFSQVQDSEVEAILAE